MGATEKIAKWIIDTGYEDIPPDAIRVANESCFDLLGVILAGSTQPVADIIQQYVADQGVADEATVLATGQRSTSSQAALANGTMGHALDYDDFGGFGHPTVAIFPALLALGEKTGATGRDLLEAYVVGCEVGLALQHTTKYNQMEKGFHATAVIGHMACTSACAKLLGLDEQQTTMALGMGRFHGRRPDPQLWHHDQTPARRLGLPERNHCGPVGAEGPDLRRTHHRTSSRVCPHGAGPRDIRPG